MEISRFQKIRLFTTGPQSTAWEMWSRAQLCRKESYKEFSRILGILLNRMELRAGCSFHETLGYYIRELRWKPRHTHWDNALRNERKL